MRGITDAEPRERPILFAGPMVCALHAGTKSQTRRAIKPQPDPRCTEALRGADGVWRFSYPTARAPVSDSEWDARCPYGAPGDRLWVREAWAPEQYDASAMAIAALETSVRKPAYRADFRGEPAYKWRPSIHMPRKASRILLEVTDVRVERLQDISEADAIAEGIFELVPAANRGEGLTAGALALAATMTVDRMPRASRRSFLRGTLAAALGFVASPSRPWEVHPTRWTRAPSPQQVYALLWESINGPGSWDANPWVWAVSFERSKP